MTATRYPTGVWKHASKPGFWLGLAYGKRAMTSSLDSHNAQCCQDDDVAAEVNM